MRILVTGGCGFIGAAVIRLLLSKPVEGICNVDKLTYASNPLTVEYDDSRYRFAQEDICDGAAMSRLFKEFRPQVVMHLAAESHVDRSIDGPAEFLKTNIFGTFSLLDSALAYWRSLDAEGQKTFRFHHISTDEVYGDLEPDEPAFTEQTAYAPSSPYSASKAASDHLVRAWNRTYGLPVIVSNCSNNYGPGQFPEKLIPLMILNAVEGRPLPVYGDGMQVRDWLYVEDHAEALWTIMTQGEVGETYNVGGMSERRNIEVVQAICDILEEQKPEKPEGVARYSDLITSVVDRPGHDRRYAIDSGKIASELGWNPRETFDSGLRSTVNWYLNNRDWCDRIKAGIYDGQRIGVGAQPERQAAL